ncbi:homoserine dehydrogenase [Brevibacterium sp. 50QC2O2]|jgi:homoserine dehydrogenase|uniref:homoserine dehydrogenase n=1 Tax=Brevibacterium TaxID=1696 RepID=UPI00211CDA03|nr:MULTISPECIES: homoserine dehydrogenase [unclassified Brevibacterium]MCQ9384789.1 homoserine dehydrogenase [Brevibacterium sp. 68QC2CO]MCQ9387551.1 homoserine dehydrogenase [Brevibacterium sp. 50QC2O2]
MTTDPLKVTLLGCGVVGTEVATRLLNRRTAIGSRIGAQLELSAVVVRDLAAERPGLPRELLTTDAESAIAGADIVVELMGGMEPAKTLILKALSAGASVVTANKALLAAHYAELMAAADDAGVRLEHEAAVAGAIPIIRPVGDSLAGDEITKVMGIVNGTTNYILDQMEKEGWDFSHALSTAQELGFAEADPTADIEGHDAAAKAAILASLAFDTPVSIDQVPVEGISSITPDMIATAAAQGFTIKLLAICERIVAADGTQGVSARVYPAVIPADHALAQVGGAFNAVFVEAEAAGQLMFYGQGAGGAPTASAVLGDIVSVARRKVLGGRGMYEHGEGRILPVLDIGEITTHYQITLDVADRPGVLSRITEVFAAHDVSIELVQQTRLTEPGTPEDLHAAKLVIATHSARESALAATVDALRGLDAVNGVLSVLRIEGL